MSFEFSKLRSVTYITFSNYYYDHNYDHHYDHDYD